MTTTPSSQPLGTAAQLCDYTSAILGQMTPVIESYVGQRASDYAEHVGAHMRHIIEHYDALLKSVTVLQTGTTTVCKVDYDARERNLEVEANPLEAIRRIKRIAATFGSDSGMQASDMAQVVQVHVRGGLNGEHDFCTLSSVARELMFLNSHATHHFAILQGYARERGQTLGAGVGKAPATVAHEQRLNKSKVAA
jgi:hypothetical protein